MEYLQPLFEELYLNIFIAYFSQISQYKVLFKYLCHIVFTGKRERTVKFFLRFIYSPNPYIHLNIKQKHFLCICFNSSFYFESKINLHSFYIIYVYLGSVLSQNIT